MELVSQELLSQFLSNLNEMDQQLVQLKLAGQSTAETARNWGSIQPTFACVGPDCVAHMRERGCL